jgi:hypothetical protein
MNMMRLKNVFGASAAFGLALGAAALILPSPSAAQTADEDVSFDTKIMRGIMEGLGFKRDGEPTISYRERSPLVIPPSRELPAPERSDAVIANNPAWPKDVDIDRRKAIEKQEKGRNVSDEREREQNPLRPDQLTPGGRPKKKQASTDDGYQPPATGFGSQIMPSELGFKGIGSFFSGSKKEETAKFTNEPPRTSLTDPPPGYQTPSPDHPYGLSKGAATAKPADYYSTQPEPKR